MKTFVEISPKSSVEAKSLRSRIAANLLLGGLGKASALLSIFLSADLAINSIGSAEFGSFVSMLAVQSWIQIFDLGVGNAVQNGLVSAKENRDYVKRTALKNFLKLRSVSIGVLIALIVGVVGETNIPYLIAGVNPQPRNSNLEATFILIGCGLVISWCANPFKTLLFADGNASLWNVFSLVTGAIYITLVFNTRTDLLSSGQLAGSYLISQCCALIAVATVYKLSSNRSPPNKMPKGNESPLDANQLIRDSGGFLLLQIMAMTLYQMDLLLVTNLGSPHESGVYYLATRFSLITVVAWGLVLQPVWPELSKHWARGDSEGIIKLVTKLAWIGLVFGVIVAAIIQILYNPLKEIVDPAGIGVTRQLLLLASLTSILRIWVETWAIANNALTLFSTQLKTAALQIVIFGCTATLLIPKTGATGALIAHSVALLAVPLWVLPRCIKKACVTMNKALKR